MEINYMSLPFDFKNRKKDELLEVLNDLSVNRIDFYDEYWACDKKTVYPATDLKCQYSIYFNGTPKKYNDWLRYYALAMFKNGSKYWTVANNVKGFKTFLEFLHKYYNDMHLENVEITEINKYKNYLDEKYQSEDTKHSKWSSVSNFYIKMKGADSFFNHNIVSENPFTKKRNNDSKYIPEFITKKLDELCKNEAIPLETRTAYWIMRFIPSRIGEICKLPIDCVKKIKDGWTLTLNMWKQNGGYNQPELRVIRFKNTSVEGNYLYNVIKKQQKVAKSLQSKLPQDKEGFLFTYNKHSFNSVGSKKSGKIKYYEYKDIIIVASSPSMGLTFQNICEKHNIKDENGQVYHITSHFLRHNGITDRLVEGGFEVDDIMGITHQKSPTMILNSYTHPTKEKILRIQEKVLDSKEDVEEMDTKAVYFKGKIMNIDEMVEKRLLRDIRKHKLKLGICSDISECKKGYRCLEGCNDYIPDYDDLPYFENEIEQWSRKVEFYNKQNLTFQKENAEFNLRNHIKIRERILDSIKGEIESG